MRSFWLTTSTDSGEEGVELKEAIVRAGRIRLRPILMTTLTTICGLIPMALGMGEGAEANASLAIAVIGGLSVSTFLTLVFVPTLYMIAESWRATRGAAKGFEGSTRGQGSYHQ